MDEEYITEHLIRLMKVMKPNAKGHYAYLNAHDKYVFGITKPRLERNVVSSSIAIYLIINKLQDD